MTLHNYEWKEVVKFWFEELSPAEHYKKSDALDKQISERFFSLHSVASIGELYYWRESAHGRLAEIIVLDQLSRNIFRGQAKSFAYDSLALILAQEAVRIGADNNLKTLEKSFLYMPFMHSESLVIHQRAIELFSQDGLENNLIFEKKHKIIIEKFGRYPHRNSILGRKSTPEEIEFLKGPDSKF